jgi:hypothetical protein
MRCAIALGDAVSGKGGSFTSDLNDRSVTLLALLKPLAAAAMRAPLNVDGRESAQHSPRSHGQ